MDSDFLKQPYQPEEFKKFFRQFLPDDFEPKRESLFLSGFQLLKSAELIGECSSLDLKVYEIKHSSENDPRVTLSKEAFKLVQKYNTEKALVIFTSENSRNYRLSLITFQRVQKTDTKVKKEFSNPRRYSFFLGPDAKVNTPHKFLIQKEQVKDFDDLLSRFSVEVVNKEFYQQIAKFFSRLIGGERKFGSKIEKFDPEMVLPSVSFDDKKTYQEFTVRLIGRIIFCWFLKQKKSGEGISLLPDEYLSKEAVFKQEDYYHSVLEKIFFEILNKPVNQRKGELRSGYDKIPYLNGGLFDPHNGDDFYDGQANYGLKIPNNWFKDLFEVLETYNFTIDENTVLDVDLSIDPEMLGRIFENLLAEINPETGESARKSTGSYYTPRSIVEYMVDQSLTQYLLAKTDISAEKIKALVSADEGDDEDYPLSSEDKYAIIGALNEVKIIDPACGSGAFPIGILQKIVWILSRADKDGKLWFDKKTENLDSLLTEDFRKKFANENFDYIRKTGIIRDSIYGVDIQPIAVEVSKLRCFLTLIVDEDIDDGAENRGIKPLPNLEFKFVAANTLINLPGIGQTNLFENHDQIDRLKRLRDKYFISSGYEKIEVRSKFKDIQRDMFKNQISVMGQGQMTMALADWNPFSNDSSEWFDPEWMFGINKFDIVIANPPYDVYQGHKKNEIEILNKIAIYEKAKGGKLNAYKLFLAKSIELQKKEAILCEIFQNSFLADKSASRIRQFFLNNQRIISLDSFPERDDTKKRVFEGVKMSVCVLLSKNVQVSDDYQFALNIWSDRQMTEVKQSKIGKSVIQKIDPDSQTIPMCSADEISLLEKLSLLPRMKEIGECFEGEINLTFHKSFLRKTETDGMKMIKGAAVQQWKIVDKMSQGEIEYLDSKEYLSKNHGEKSLHHLKSRIVMQGMTGVDEKQRLKMTIIDPDIFCGNSVNYFLLNTEKVKQKYILSLFNSKVLNWYFKSFSTNSNVNNYEVHNLPLIIADQDQQENCEKLVDKIITASKNNDHDTVKSLETELNNIVYKMFNLNHEEIKIVEDSVR